MTNNHLFSFFFFVLFFLGGSLHILCQNTRDQKFSPSLYTDAWVTVSGEKRNELSESFKHELNTRQYPVPRVEEIRGRRLACYENGWIYELYGYVNQTARLYTLISVPGYNRLLGDGYSAVQDVNKHQFPLLADSAQLSDYVRLYVGAGFGEFGRFRIIGSEAEARLYLTQVGQIYWEHSGVHVVRGFSVLSSVKEVATAGKNFLTTLKYDHGLFNVNLNLSPAGITTITKDSLIFSFPFYTEYFAEGGAELSYHPNKLPVNEDFYSENGVDYFTYGKELLDNAKDEKGLFSSFTCFENGAALGHPDSYWYLGILWSYHRNQYKNPNLTKALMNASTEMGYIPSQLLLGDKFRFGWGNNPDAEKALGFYKTIARSGDSTALERIRALTKEIETGEFYYLRSQGDDHREILYKYKSIFPQINLPIYSGKIYRRDYTLFKRPINVNNTYYDAILIRPEQTGYLYWGYTEPDAEKHGFSWYLIKCSNSEGSSRVMNDSLGFFERFLPLKPNGILQESTLALEKGSEYILWFSLDDKDDFDEATRIDLRLTLLAEKMDLQKFLREIFTKG